MHQNIDTKAKLAQTIDHTLLRSTATEPEFFKLCNEAIDFQFKTVCVPLSWISYCKNNLKQKGPMVATVIGFPLGNQSSEGKYFEIDFAIKNGADELDIVFDLGRFLSGQYKFVESELKKCQELSQGKCTKIIVESGALNIEQIATATKLVLNAGANYIKTSTGFFSIGATTEAVKKMAEISQGKIKIKASGGIKTLSQAQEYIRLGASRLGCSQSIEIVNSFGGN